MKKIVLVIAAAAAIAGVGGLSYMISHSADNIEVSTENDYIDDGRNRSLPEGLTVFSENGDNTAISPAMWKATSPEGISVYLLGAIHSAKDECYPLPKYITDAFNECDKISCEINNVDVVRNYFSRDKVYTPDPTLPEGDSIENHLTPRQYELLSKYLADHGENIEGYKDKSPWYVYSNEVNSVKETQESTEGTLSATIGIDRILMISSNIAGKEILELETEEAKQTMYSSLPEDVMGAVIERDCGMTDADKEQLMTDSYESWKKGDIETIENMAYDTSGVSEESVPLMEKYNQIFVVDRNRVMADKIEGYLNDGLKVLAVPGAAHLVGENGIPAMLERDGYKVERVH